MNSLDNKLVMYFVSYIRKVKMKGEAWGGPRTAQATEFRDEPSSAPTELSDELSSPRWENMSPSDSMEQPGSPAAIAVQIVMK